MMRAMRAESFTGYGGLKLVEVPRPRRADGRVLVRITAAGVTPLDHTILSGGYPRATAPLILGNEGAGVVEDPGDSVFSEGDRVMFAGPYGVSEDGTYSEWIAVRGEDLCLIPDNIDDATAGGMPVAYLTPRGGCRHRQRGRCPDGSRARHACPRRRSDLAGILGRARDDDRRHGLDLEAREHEWLLAVRAIACDQSGRLGHHPATTDLGKSEADRRTSVQAGRGRRSSPPSDRRPPLRPSGVGGLVTEFSPYHELRRYQGFVRDASARREQVAPSATHDHSSRFTVLRK